MKRVLKNRRKSGDRRKSKRNNTIDRRTQSEQSETEYVIIPIQNTSSKKTIPDDFEEGACEQIIVEHPVEKIMLTIMKEVDYMSVICLT